MNEEFIDRRVRKTKKQLLIGLTKLMQEKSIKDITVRELSDLADINRGTFYLHYRDVYDMIEQVENEMLESFNTVVKKHTPGSLKGHPTPLFLDILNFMAENSEMCMALLGKNGDIAFVNKLAIIIKEKWLSYWRNNLDSQNLPLLEYHFSFVESGCIGLFQQWLKGGMKESKEQIAQLIDTIIIQGVMGFGILKDS